MKLPSHTKGSPYNDGPKMTGMELYHHWVELAKRVSTDLGIPEDKRLHATIFLEGMGMLERKGQAKTRPAKRAKRTIPRIRIDENVKYEVLQAYVRGWRWAQSR